MERLKIAIIDSTENSYVAEPDLEKTILQDIADVSLLKVPNRDALAGHLDDLDGIISWHCIPITANEIDQLHRCKAIVRAAVGYDNIDIEYAAARGIPVSTVPDYGTGEVADHTLALILSLARRLPLVDAEAKTGNWDWRQAGQLTRLAGRKLGIIGFGRIGTAVARRATPFGLNVAFFDPYVPDGFDKSQGVERYEDLDALIRDADIISLHAPLTEETRHIIGKKQLDLMDKNTILINTARGDLIDQQALLDALESKQIEKLGLDVLANEPNVPAQLCDSPDIILSSHAAFYSNEGLTELRRKSASTLRKALLGENIRSTVNGVTAVEHSVERLTVRRSCSLGA